MFPPPTWSAHARNSPDRNAGGLKKLSPTLPPNVQSVDKPAALQMTACLFRWFFFFKLSLSHSLFRAKQLASQARPGQLGLTSKRWPDTWGTAGRLSSNTVRTAFLSLLAKPEDKSSIPWLRLSRGAGQRVKKNWIRGICVSKGSHSCHFLKNFFSLYSQNSDNSHLRIPKTKVTTLSQKNVSIFPTLSVASCRQTSRKGASEVFFLHRFLTAYI